MQKMLRGKYTKKKKAQKRKRDVNKEIKNRNLTK